MVPEREQPESESKEAMLPAACMSCGGDLHLKVTGNIAVSYCTACHFVARPEITVTFNGLKVHFKHAGQA